MAKPEAAKSNSEVTPIDFDKPVAVIVHQTKARNYSQSFNGDDAIKEAVAAASDIAINQNRKCVVIGPGFYEVKIPIAGMEAPSMTPDFMKVKENSETGEG